MISDFLTPDAVFPALKVGDKKHLLQELATKAAMLTGLEARDVFEALLQRERLGPTAVGEGVAIPHGRIAKLERLFGLFVRLEKPIDYEANDGRGVDMIFLLLAPETAGADHLKALASVARVMRDPSLQASMRQTSEKAALYALLTQNS